MAKTIAIDFDGVIHKYSKGWHDGTCYDEPVEGVFDAISHFFRCGYSVFIFSTRKPKEIKKWIDKYIMETTFVRGDATQDPGPDFDYPTYGFKSEIISMFTKFWNKKNVLGITRRKLPALVYVDDRALKFNGVWRETVSEIENFKTYQYG